jgi:hypothetical protein
VGEVGGQRGLLGDGGLLEAEEGGGGDPGGRGDGGEATGGRALPSGELGRGGDNLGHSGGHLLGRLQEALPHRWCGSRAAGGAAAAAAAGGSRGGGAPARRACVRSEPVIRGCRGWCG